MLEQFFSRTHTEAIAGIDELAQLFSIFHDGVIIDAAVQGNDLLLTVRISYLAQRIQPGFTTFAVHLHEVEGLSFCTWPKAAAPSETLRDPPSIFSPPLDILSGEVSDGCVRVVCNQPSALTAHCGGTLTFRAESATVSDEQGRLYSTVDLAALATAYWDEWGQRAQKP